jgi:Carboxypeptidase regulatory-like domain
MRFAYLTLVMGVVVVAGLRGQAPAGSGSIAGTVVDPVGSPAANVVVQARGADGTPRRATSGKTGKFVIADLPAGAYDVSVNVPGLRGFERKDVRVAAGAAFALDIHLEEGTQLSTLGEDAQGIAADRLRHAPPSGPTPRGADGKPDFTGVWWQPVVVEPGTPEWLPAARQVAAQRQANNRKDSPQVFCLPPAVLRRGPLIEFVQSSAVIVEISDDDSPGFHKIYLNRRDHPKEPDLLWYGDSVGHWEGATLVVDRVNFVEDVWLDQDAHPHGDQLHIVERYTRPDLGHLEVVVTVDDPGVLANPWTFKRVSELAPKEELREFICNENNSDLPHLVGK